MRNIQAKIVHDVEFSTTRITIEVTAQNEMNCPPAPRFGRFGDGWILLDNVGIDMAHGEDVGWWDVQPEGVAMQLLRAAWAMAHKEQQN